MRRHCEQILQKFAWQSINLKCILNSLDFSLSSESSKWQCLRFFKNSKIQTNSKLPLKFKFFQQILKFPNKFKISPKFWKKLNKIPKKFPKFEKNFKNSLKFFPNFHKNTKAPPPACIFSDLTHFFCFILGVGLKKFANFFRKRYFLCYNFNRIWICLANEW